VTNSLSDLAARWLQEADLLDRYGCSSVAETCRMHADELEAAWKEWEGEELTIKEAAQESGYSPEQLRKLVRDGEIPDLRPEGSQGPIWIRRCDLPRRPGANEGVRKPHQSRPDRDPIDAFVDRLIDG